MDLTFDEVFKVPLICLKLIRAHPDIPKDLRWFILFVIVYGVYFFFFIIQMYNITEYNLKAHDFAQTCKNGTFCVIDFAVLFIYVVLVWKKKFLINLFENVKMDYIKAKELSIEEQEIVLKYAKQSKWVGQLWFIVVLFGVTAFPSKNIILHTYYYFIGDFHWVHLYDLTYPEIINERKDQKIVFCFLYAILICYMSYCGLVYASFVPLGLNFMLHACGQLEILTNRVDKFFLKHNSVLDTMNEIKSVAIELQKIYNFVEEIKIAFRLVYELLLKIKSIVFPVTLYGVIEAFAEGDLCVEFVVFIVGSVIVASAPCYYGELLMEKGEMFRMAVYSCGWERTYDRRTRIMILLLLQCATRPIAIRTIFRTLCLDTLADVSRHSYAIFNLMNAMWK